MLAPAQSLHVLLLRLCRQVLAPPQFARAPLEDAGAPAVLARSSVAVIMADACSPAVLACAPLAVIMADACAPAVLACAPLAVMQSAPAFLHALLSRLCWQMLAPPAILAVGLAAAGALFPAAALGAFAPSLSVPAHAQVSSVVAYTLPIFQMLTARRPALLGTAC